MPLNYLKTMGRKQSLYCISILFALIAAWWIWDTLANRNSQIYQSNAHQDDVSNGNGEERLHEVPGAIPNASTANGMSNNERNSTTSIKINLVPVKNASFVARIDELAPDYKHWNKIHDLYLIESSVWYELHDSMGRKVFRFPNYINVDAGGRPGALDRARGDIKWQWADDLSVIGVQQIIQRRESAPSTRLEGEFSELPPDSARIYLFDVKKLNSVYELVPPEFPKGFVVRIEGVSDDGYISLAALSPKAYNQGDDFKNDPGHCVYLGVYKYKK